MAVEGFDDGDLGAAFDLLRESIFTELRVAGPGVVNSYDPVTRQAEIQPLIKRKAFGAESPVALPPVPNVPVLHPQTQAGALILPVAAGDPVLLVFTDRSLDDWKASNGSQPTEAKDKRKHDFSDCYAILGGWPSALSFTPATDAANLALQVASGTKMYLGNDTDELLSIMHAVFEQLETLLDYKLNTESFSNGGGPTGPATTAVGNVDTVKDAVEEQRTKLENLKV